MKVVERAGLGDDKNLRQEISEVSKACKVCKEFARPSPTPVVGMPHAEHFNETLNRPPPTLEADIQEAEADLDVNIAPPEIEEIISSIKSD